MSTPCLSCGDPHDLSIAVCPACVQTGHCTICGGAHRAWQCPLVAAEWARQEAIEMAAQRADIAARAAQLLAEFEAWPVWMEAA